MQRQLLTALLALAAFLFSPAHADPARLAQLIDYVGVDYAVAVQDGEIISEFEYAEMHEFGALIEEQIETLPDAEARNELQPLAQQLNTAIRNKADPEKVADIAAQMTTVLLRSPGLVVAPTEVPGVAKAKDLYMAQCASCHGVTGQGDGPAAPGMEPEPTDFTDKERAQARSLYGLFNTITLGVEGTPMPAFGHLSADERWALAFHVGSLYAEPETLARGQRVLEARTPDALPDLRELTTATPSSIAAEQGEDAAALHARLRHDPEALRNTRNDPLLTSINGVRHSVDLYAQGQTQAAHDAAVDAYLEGFELVEAPLSATRSDLVLEVENAMTGLRQAIRKQQSLKNVSAAADDAIALLEEARAALSGDSLSPTMAFVSALIILLREGLEAILVLGAMGAFLNKTGRREGLPWLHAGWMAALAAGIVTWIVSTYLITISGATREVTEGITALIAAAVLFYVGFWMHSRLNAQRWQQFIHESIQNALDKRGLWALAGIAFIAVYREVFETVLFLQALSVQATAEAAGRGILAGFITGSVIIVVAAWTIFRFGVRLPLRQFFGITAAIMITLAVIFAGKGIAALQEAGKLPLDPIAFPRIELLGIYPTAQSIGVQLIVLAAALALIIYNARSSRTVRA